VGLLLLGVTVGAWWMFGDPISQANRLFESALRYQAEGKLVDAERAAERTWELDASREDALILAARAAAGYGNYEAAVVHLAKISDAAEPEVQYAGCRLAAEIYFRQLVQLGKAETAYRRCLELQPTDKDVHLGLADLLALCARRHESVPHYLQLIRLGEVSDFMMLLARESGIIDNTELLARAVETDPSDPSPLLGLAWHAQESGDRDRAEALLIRAIERKGDFVPAHVALGMLLVDAGRFEEIAAWNSKLPSGAEDFPGTWIVRAKGAEHQQDIAGAIRCYGEAVTRSPESKVANSRLAQLLEQVGQRELAQAFGAYSLKIQELADLQDRLFFSDGPSGIEALLGLVQRYQQLGRIWEALGWCQLARELEPEDLEIRRVFAALRERLHDAPLRQTFVELTPAGRLVLSDFALPTYESKPSPFDPLQSTIVGLTGKSHPQFRDDSETVGIRFSYFNGAKESPQRKMYEFTGGGIGVLDFDADSFPDCYFSQGREWPVEPAFGKETDSLFRNVRGQKFEDVSIALGSSADGFGQGVTVGDMDGDGFPDLYVANIGRNCLFRNNGDGTFSDVTTEFGIAGEHWTTSCVMADINGDGLADIYDVNYVQGKDVFERVCVGDDGQPAICMPFDFDAAADVLWMNSAKGRFEDATASTIVNQAPGKGLGVVTAKHESGGLGLFVANDTTPNCWLVPTEDHDASGDSGAESVSWKLRDRAVGAGLAFNADGKAEGSMGIAAGDVDNDGMIDFLVTNFLNESNSLYVSQGQGVYAEKTRGFGLHDASLNVLGFGAQFLDANLDGRLELIVANGHIDDLRRFGKDYEMPTQLFAVEGRRFVELDSKRLGDYFEGRWLGRSVAKIDWNVDGKEDLLIGHLRGSSRLLTNTTEGVGNAVTVRLVGTESSRDAIGATVEMKIGDGLQVKELAAGDGYQASNQRQLIFGMGDASEVDQITVRWPSGRVQQWGPAKAGDALLLVEGSNGY
jgi:tetratricopeptide (TPR) repeat protein